MEKDAARLERRAGRKRCEAKLERVWGGGGEGGERQGNACT